VKHVHYTQEAAVPVTEAGARGISLRWVISEKDGAENFFMRVVSFQPDSVSPAHQHPYEHETFVLSGRGTLEVEGKKVELKPGDAVFIPGGSHHCFKSDEGMEMMCLIPNPEV